MTTLRHLLVNGVAIPLSKTLVIILSCLWNLLTQTYSPPLPQGNVRFSKTDRAELMLCDIRYFQILPDTSHTSLLSNHDKTKQNKKSLEKEK